MNYITECKQRINQMEAGVFQILCDALLSKLGYERVESLGTSSSSNKTTKGTPDSIFKDLDGKYVFVEYTVQQSNLENKIQSDLDKCFEKNKDVKLSSIICFYNDSNLSVSSITNFVNKCMVHDIGFKLFSIDEISEKIVYSYPILGHDFLDLEIDTHQILDLEDFEKEYDKQFESKTGDELIGRTNEIQELSNKFNQNENIILCGQPGVGKTALAIGFAKTVATKYKVKCIKWNHLEIWNDIYRHFEKDKDYLVIIDDANNFNSIELLIQKIKDCIGNGKIIFLLPIRKYALNDLKNNLTKLTFNFEVFEIKPLSNENIAEALKRNTDLTNEDFILSLSNVSKGNARIAFMAYETMKKNKFKTVFSDYGNVLTSFYSDRIDKENINEIKILSLISCYKYINKNDFDLYKDLIFSISKNEFDDIISKAEIKEIIENTNDIVTFTDQCMKDFFFQYGVIEHEFIFLSEIIKRMFKVRPQALIDNLRYILSFGHTNDNKKYIQKCVMNVWNQIYELKDSKSYILFVKMFGSFDSAKAVSFAHTEFEKLPKHQIDYLRESKPTNINDYLSILSIQCNNNEYKIQIINFFIDCIKDGNQYSSDANYLLRCEYDLIEGSQNNYQNELHIFNHLLKFKENKFIKETISSLCDETLAYRYERSFYKNKQYGIYSLDVKDDYECYSIIRNKAWEAIRCLSFDNQIKLVLKFSKKFYSYEKNKTLATIDLKNINKILNQSKLTDLEKAIILTCLKKNDKADLLDLNDYSKEVISYVSYFNEFIKISKSSYDEEIDLSYLNNFETDDLVTRIELIDTSVKMQIKFDISLFDFDLMTMILKNVSNEKKKDVLDILLVKYIDIISDFDGQDLTILLIEIYGFEKAYEIIAHMEYNSNSLYYVFEMLQVENINDIWTNRFIEFLKERSKFKNNIISYRRFEVIDKFKNNKNFDITKALEIISSKEEYSYTIPRMYFLNYFHSHQSVEDGINTFGNLDKLENAVILLLRYDKINSGAHKFLIKLCEYDNTFISKLFSKFHELEHTNIFEYLWESGSYIELITCLFDVCCSSLKSDNDYLFSNIDSYLGFDPIGCLNFEVKKTEWLRQVITIDSFTLKQKEILFKCINRLSNNDKMIVIKEYVNKYLNLDEFKCLFNILQSIDGVVVDSFIPLLESKKELFGRISGILPNDLKYIGHRKYLSDMIKDTDESIIRQKIDEFIEKMEVSYV